MGRTEKGISQGCESGKYFLIKAGENVIFVTVGTHEQPFDRLIKKVDELKKEGLITDDVQMQTGYCTYQPQYCSWSPFYTYKEMQEFVQKADIVITHGGPSSFIMPLQIGKIPIVVPRQARYKEHINNHQVEFCKAVRERQGNIIVVEDISDLSQVLQSYSELITDRNTFVRSNNKHFNEELERLVNKCLQ